MSAPTFVVGIGGTGLQALLRVKERFLEAYDKVPDEVILFELDTDDYATRRDEFNEVGLLVTNDTVYDSEGNVRQVTSDAAEFYYVHTSDTSMTLGEVFKRKVEGPSKQPQWQWVNEPRLKETIKSQADERINAGAGTIRSKGRAILFLDYANVYQQLATRLDTIINLQNQRNPSIVVGESGVNATAGVTDDNKATVFVVASVAGGSGAGMVIDVLRMFEHMLSQRSRAAAPVSVQAILVGGKAFSSDSWERQDSNAFAAMRELDRLGAVAGPALNRAVPSVMWAPGPVKRFASGLGPADLILFMDGPDRLGNRRTQSVKKTGSDVYRDFLVAPTIADLVLAFADEKIAPAIRSVRADKLATWMGTDPFDTNLTGYYPYCSAGLHTLIFPERDVRKAAGLKLLLELWDDYLIPTSPEKLTNMPEVTTTLWGEHRNRDKKLDPVYFADQEFQQQPVCTGAPNNSFIQTVVFSAQKGEIRLPPGPNWVRVLFGASNNMVKRVLALIGIPKSGRAEGADDSSQSDVEAIAEQIEERINASIEELKGEDSAEGVQAWREKYIGEGTLGSEVNGEWEELFSQAWTVTGHKADFGVVLRGVVKAILNDTDREGKRLKYRLQYADQVLDRLSKLVLLWTAGEKSRGALLEQFFERQTIAQAAAAKKVTETEGPALRGGNLKPYRSAMLDYAKASRELVGKKILDLLCKDLQQEIENLRTRLAIWISSLTAMRRSIAQEQSSHKVWRDEKAQIPVRTYVTNDQFEKDLFQRHHDDAVRGFLTELSWEWAGTNFKMLAPFGRPDGQDQSIEAASAAQRAINWACTKRGNPDRPDAGAPLARLASPQEVLMSQRVHDHFTSARINSLLNLLTDQRILASLCPLKNPWPPNRLMYTLGLHRRAPLDAPGVERFYAELDTSISNNTGPTRYHFRTLKVYEPENPRHTLAAELAVGFRLQHRTDYDDYIEKYRDDTDKFYALHCLPEEDAASTDYELKFDAKKDPFKGLKLPAKPLLLDSTVVDLLGSRERLDLFVRATTAGIIGRLPQNVRIATGQQDYFVWPRKGEDQRIRLSKMGSPGEVDEIARNLVSRATELNNVIADPDLMARLRLMYAMRTFILLEHDVDREDNQISYEDVRADAEKALAELSIDERVNRYNKLLEGYRKSYTDYNASYPMIAHLMLVLAQVAYTQRLVEESNNEEQTVD